MNDPRENLPSASALPRLAACPGSLALCRQLPEPPESEESHMGTRIHAAWAKGGDDSLSLQEQDTVERLMELEQVAFEAWQEMTNAGDAEMMREERLWLRKGLKVVMSGQEDVMWTAPTGFALILDGKSGWMEVEPSDINLQLKAYAVLAWLEYGSNAIHVGILQPKVSGKVRLTKYEESDLVDAQREIMNILAACEDPNAPLHPGPDCRYCPASLLNACPALQQEALKLAQMREILGPISLKNLPSGELAGLMGKVDAVEALCEGIREETKRRAAGGMIVSDGQWQWTVKEIAGKRGVKDMVDAFQQMSRAGMTIDEFLECCSVSIGDLVELWRKTHPKHLKDGSPRPGTEKDANEGIANALGSNLKRGEPVQKLVRQPARLEDGQ